MHIGNMTTRDVALLTSHDTAQAAHRGRTRRLLQTTGTFIMRLLTAAPPRTVVDLGDHQLRDIGLWRVDRSVPLECAQRAFSVHEAWGRLRMF
jgi:uncharacterized protein YjiS (DUF1127 family)